MNRVDRLMAIVVRLQGRRVVRAEDLAAHFEISVRTVYRDIAATASRLREQIRLFKHLSYRGRMAPERIVEKNAPP